ncbi:hypothetical protein O6H91_07G118500 [Diphasiastrum complanatum]|uniref:Uncharacterized protein n=1 Tax=Diphasiastrum complanatum TaxID=34168 RepID=A0ACC2D9J5_DIPCM|nr:hypothetical protein O6H91_07G118500 [Diphasiastrum complanatum]
MPREIITIQCGQCGNQVGHKFWDMALREHAASNPRAIFDHALSSLFRNVNSRIPSLQIPVADGKHPIRSLKARAVLIDMEEGAVNQLLKGPLSELFDEKQLFTSTAGSGNNWACGHDFYGPKYADVILEKVRREVELCQSLQSFFLLHSLGGGTGSGLGSYIFELLHDAYPKVFRVSAAVFPSADDDVITSPYNSLFSTVALAENADCVFTVDNLALIEIIRKSTKPIFHNGLGLNAHSGAKWRDMEKPFDGMNGIVSQLLLHLTSSVRFEGSLNVDLNQIPTNLIPYPRLRFLVSSMGPLNRSSPSDMAKQSQAFNQIVSEVFSRDNQLIKCNPMGSTFLACALFARGERCTISDLNDSLARVRKRVKMIHWNTEGFKMGICHQPALGLPISLLCVANNTCMRTRFLAMKGSFNKLYKRRVYVHHYAEYMNSDDFKTYSGELDDLIEEYANLDIATAPAENSQFKPPATGF